MKITLGEIALAVDGKIVGDTNHIIKGVAEIQDASSGTITFLSNPSYKNIYIVQMRMLLLLNKKSF